MDIGTQIRQLAKEKNAIILAHNYQLPEVQDIADFTGDSLELARKAVGLTADIAVFCGVHFMAETAAILSPEKKVLLPDPSSGCPMADMATEEDVRRLRAAHPNAVFVCYVNSTAAVKAACDVCCTSSNAVDIVARIPQEYPIVFVPDQYLAGHVERLTGRAIIKFEGYCPTHALLLPEHVARARQAHPGAPVIVHPESRGDVCTAADAALSTGQMCAYAKTSSAAEIVVGTEVGLLHRLRKENPDKVFHPLVEQAVCPNMKKNTLEKVLWALSEEAPQVTVDPDLAQRARGAIERMLGDGPITPRQVSV